MLNKKFKVFFVFSYLISTLFCSIFPMKKLTIQELKKEDNMLKVGMPLILKDPELLDDLE